MHIKRIPQQMRLMSPSLPQTLKLGLLIVVQQNRLIVGMSTFVDDDSRSLLGTQTTHVGETLFCDDDVEIVLCEINVSVM